MQVDNLVLVLISDGKPYVVSLDEPKREAIAKIIKKQNNKVKYKVCTVNDPEMSKFLVDCLEILDEGDIDER